jgi:hypothetical protein
MTAEKTSESAGTPSAGVKEIPDLPNGIPAGPEWLDAMRRSAWTTYHEMADPDRASHLWRYSEPASFLLPPGTGPALASPSATAALGLIDETTAADTATRSLAAADTLVRAREAGITIMPLHVAAREASDLVRTHIARRQPVSAGR